MPSLKYIFLVDDDRDDQDFFIEAVREIENAKLFGVANNGLEALKMLTDSALPPDLIFLDFNMPVMNGLECLKGIKKLSVTKDIPVFMLSSAFEQAELSKKLGAKGFIKKSTDITALRTALNQVINLGLTINYVITNETNSSALKK